MVRCKRHCAGIKVGTRCTITSNASSNSNAPADFSLARLPEQLNGYVAAAPQLRRLHTVYYDTRDRRLSRCGCSLRYRFGEGWTLKLAVAAGGSELTRIEHIFSGDPQTVPAAALELATPYLRGAPVAHVAELRTVRASRDVRSANGETLAQIVEDDVRVVRETQVSDRFRQVEVELADSAETSALDAFAALLRERGAGRPNPMPKDVRALGRDPNDRGIPLPKLRRGACMLDVTKASLARSVERIIRNDAAIRLGHDAQAVHKARTSVRRLRSDLRTFEPAFENRMRARSASGYGGSAMPSGKRATPTYCWHVSTATHGRYLLTMPSGRPKRPHRFASHAKPRTSASYMRCDNRVTSNCSTIS